MNLAQTLCAALLGWLAGTGSAGSAEAPCRVFLVPMPAEAAWQDLAFLAALPAASATNEGTPLVLALAPDGGLAPETQDFLARYHPRELTWIGAEPRGTDVSGAASTLLAADSADSAACAIAGECFGQSARAVVVREDDYPSALLAAVLAARLRAPLFFCGDAGLSAAARAAIERVGAGTLLLVGDLDKARVQAGKQALERLRDSAEVARWMQKHALPVGYLAAAAPADRCAGRVRKLSLAAAALAAGRSGSLVVLGSASAPLPDAAGARAALELCRKPLDPTPEYLCIAAMPEAIPMEAIPSGDGIDTDPPSDLAYGNIDADPFFELAVGRFVAEDGNAGTLLAARSLAYESLLSPAFADRMGMAEWERLAAPLFENVGFQPPVQHDGSKPIEKDSPLASVGVLIHNSHSSWFQIGNTYMHDSHVLLAPCLVETAGCSPASLDQDPELHSVALRLLCNGAIGFVGNVRRAIAQQELYRSEFWNAVLAGQSLGEANRSAQNRMLVSVLANGESEHGPHRYELHNEAFYGDPALVLHLPRAPKSAPARVEVHGRDVLVHAPAQWWRAEEFIVSDWNYTESPAIYSWRGAGVGVESSWDGAHHRNRDEFVFTAEVRTTRRVNGLEAVKPPPAPLGWDGKFFVDEHADGSRSVWFRVKMLDADMGAGTVLHQADSLRFRLD